MEFFEMIADRRSVRRFSDRQVSKEEIAKILKTALGAPSSKNTRSSSFLVVESPELIKRISGMRDSGSAFVERAPLVILVMGDESKTDLWVVNASISATYIQFAAEALGLGSCWVHVDGRQCKKEDPSAGMAEEYLKAFLPVPQGRHILCAIAIGHPEDTATSEKREVPYDCDRVVTL